MKAMKKKIIKTKFEPMTTQVKLTTYHQFIGTAFLGDYNSNLKQRKEGATPKRTFNRMASLFKDWKVDEYKPIWTGFL